MDNEIPDFILWREVKALSTTETLSDGTIFLEVKTYERIGKDKKIQIGSEVCFFGKEVLKIWSIFISDQKIFFKALKTDKGEWEMGLPIIKENPDSLKKGRVTISAHIEGEKNPFVSVSMFKIDGTLVKRTIFKKNDPPE
jgi:hypothetical protein